MPHFHTQKDDPDLTKISGQLMPARGAGFTLWLHDFKRGNQELDVRSDNAKVTLAKGVESGKSREWKLTGAVGETARITAVGPNGDVKDWCVLLFQAGGGPLITIRSLTKLVWGVEDEFHCMISKVPGRHIIDPASFQANTPTNALRFGHVPATTARIGAFLVSRHTFARTLIVSLPSSGTVDGILFGITHTFGQNKAFYDEYGWDDPSSADLIRLVTKRFVLDRWGAQTLAGRKNLALVMPVRSSEGGSELGALTWDGALVKQALEGISALTGRSFGTTHVEAFTFSSGIFDCNRFLTGAGKSLSLKAVYNCDPTSGTPAAAPKGVALKQYLSGETTSQKPRAGFEFMPLPRWKNEPEYRKGGRMHPSPSERFDYLHNHCIPHYTVQLALQT